MPVIEAWTAGVRGWAMRTTAAALGMVFLLIIAAGGASPAEAANWSQRIGAVRGSQLAYEGAMRAADQQLLSLKRAERRAHRKLAKARRNLKQARLRRAEAQARHRATVADVEAVRVRLTGQMESPPWPHLASLVLPPDARPALDSSAALESLETEAFTAVDSPEQVTTASLDVAPTAPQVGEQQLAEPAQAGDPLSTDSQGTMQPPTGAQPPPTGAQVAQASAEIAALERQARHQEQVVAKTRRTLHRIVRSAHVKARSVSLVRGATRAAVARREGAEAGLANAILAMSDLAQRRVAKKTSVRPGRGSDFAWPASGQITQGYGCTGFSFEPARGSCGHFHDGIDIAGYLGSPIRVAAVGVVSYIGWNPWDQKRRAFMVVVAHPGGLETLYGHILPTRNVRVGQLVRRGEVIGYMGSTGRATGVHLHLEMRRGRVTLNPLAFL